MKADAGAEPPSTNCPAQPVVACDQCGRASSNWTEWTARTAWHASGGRHAYPQVHHLKICSRCSLVWDGGEALGALLFFLSVVLLFSAFLNWPKFLWAWAPSGHMGTQTGALVFGTMALGILIWGACGMQRKLDAKALDQRELPPQPGWSVITATPEEFEKILNSATADPERDMRYPRVAFRGSAPSRGASAAGGSLAMECRRVISEFLLRDTTHEFEAANDAWWKREDLVLTLFKAELHLRVPPDELTAASNAAIDGMVREGLLQGTDSGYRASSSLANSRGAAVGAPRDTHGPAPCALCGAVPSSAPVSLSVRTGRVVATGVSDVSRQGSLTITTTTEQYANVEDVDVTLCRRCWVGGRVTWRRTLMGVALGLPVAILLALWAIISGIESAVLGFGLVAVTAVGGFTTFYFALKRLMEHHPMERVKRMVLSARAAGAPETSIICTSWPAPRPRYGE